MNRLYSQEQTGRSALEAQHTEEDAKLELDNRITKLTYGSPSYFRSLLVGMSIGNPGNAELLCKFLSFESDTGIIKPSTKQTHIKVICWFDRYLDQKDFLNVRRDDLISYFASLRKDEAEDPTHKWIGTHNTRHMILSKFIKWIYNQNEMDSKKWITPPCLQGIKPLHRKEKSPYKPSDIWTNEEHALFLKFCPDKRDRCYHAMANDTSARPHELLALKIKDIAFKVSSTGRQYAEVHLTQTKTKPRTVPLIFSIPYIKDWIDAHPMGSNPQAFLFVSLADNNFGEQLGENALYKVYTRTYKDGYFRKLVEDPQVPEGDKSRLKMMMTKPWCPYIFRHSALTSKSQILKESTLREHAGWSMTSRMPNIYIHYFGNESSKSLLEAYGIENYKQEQISVLRSKDCPNCREACKTDASFCSKCRMVLTYDAYSETLDSDKQKQDRLTLVEERLSTTQYMLQELIVGLGNISNQEQLNTVAQSLFSSGVLKVASKTGG